MRGDADDWYRFVIDESSLDWRALSPEELRDVLDTFADLLDPLADGRLVAFMAPAYEVECLLSATFADLLSTPDPRVPRDARVRLLSLIGKCRSLDPGDDDIPQPVMIAGIPYPEPSWGLSHALARTAAGRTTSCLMVPTTPGPTGWVVAERADLETDIHILTNPSGLTDFWRQVIVREKIAETGFFVYADRAFPNLLFAPSLQFNRFAGVYAEVLPWLVKLLSAVNDHFSEALARHQGDHNQVIAEFSALGLDISPESSSTKKNARAWAQRLIEYDAVAHRCEWHGKRLWNYDRVHFSLPIRDLGGKVLIGVFHEHLDT